MPFRHRRSRNSTSAQPPIQKVVLPPKPKAGELRQILKGYISPDTTQRLNALAYALQFYDKALAYCVQRRKVGADQAKSLDRAVKMRKQAQGTNILQEKETSLRLAISFYEKVCAFIHPPASAIFFKAYDAKKDILEQKQATIGDRFSDFITWVTTALSPKNPEGKPLTVIVTDAQKPFGFDPTVTQVSYDKNEARKIKDKIRREGMLGAAVEEAGRLARGAAYTLAPDGSGKYVVDTKKMVEAYHHIMQNFVHYAATDPQAPKRLAKRPVPLQAGTVPTASNTTTRPKVTRAGPTKGPKVLGLYVQGGAMAVVGQHLADHQQEWFEQNDLQKLVAAEVKGRLLAMQKHGIQHGMWKIEQQGSKWRMLLNTAPAAQQPAAAQSAPAAP
jgi:hypothetical protein